MSKHSPMKYSPEEKAQWEKDFGRPFPKTMKKWNAWLIEYEKEKREEVKSYSREMRKSLADFLRQLRAMKEALGLRKKKTRPTKKARRRKPPAK